LTAKDAEGAEVSLSASTFCPKDGKLTTLTCSRSRDGEFLIVIDFLEILERHSRCLAGSRSIQLRALTKTGFTPSVEYAVNQVIRDRVILRNIEMAILALPRAFKNLRYLFEYSRHFLYKR
jgi:hypothetical protein